MLFFVYTTQCTLGQQKNESVVAVALPSQSHLIEEETLNILSGIQQLRRLMALPEEPTHTGFRPFRQCPLFRLGLQYKASSVAPSGPYSQCPSMQCCVGAVASQSPRYARFFSVTAYSLYCSFLEDVLS